MRPEDVQAMLRVEPFVPLQVKTTDGTTYRITHPQLSMVTQQRLILGSPDPENENLACDAVFLGWPSIETVEPLVSKNGSVNSDSSTMHQSGLAVTPEMVHALLRVYPFRPLRVELTNGTVYEIVRPFLTMATPGVLLIAFPDPESNGGWGDDYVTIEWPKVKEVVYLKQEGIAT